MIYCPKCQSEKQYSGQYDAYYCELCNVWLEERCEDDSCEYCQTRPAKPSMVVDNQEETQ
jgi:hypothetical protein